MQSHATDLRSEIETEWSQLTLSPETDAAGRDHFVRQLVADWRQVDLKPSVVAMLQFTERVTQDPAALNREEIARLRTAGWNDQAIHDATQVISYFNYINRIADALGVELEEDLPRWE